ncbi:MAG TPA: hypothetical protein VMT12_15060 [Syntrophales bacterium]|nr:hypothetical protein [Syntrophales bacterium]
MKFKDVVSTATSIATIAAIFVGGVWTYDLFIMERKRYPHANIEQKVSHVALSKRTNLLRVGIELTNTGNSRLLSSKSTVRIQQIVPVPSCPEQGLCVKEELDDAFKEIERKANNFSWPLIAERENSFKNALDIEPGEKDFIEFEFVVPTKIKVVRIYSYFSNDLKSKVQNEVGWSTSSHYSFGKPI